MPEGLYSHVGLSCFACSKLEIWKKHTSIIELTVSRAKYCSNSWSECPCDPPLLTRVDAIPAEILLRSARSAAYRADNAKTSLGSAIGLAPPGESVKVSPRLEVVASGGDVAKSMTDVGELAGRYIVGLNVSDFVFNSTADSVSKLGKPVGLGVGSGLEGD